MILPNVYAVLNHYNMNTQMKNAVEEGFRSYWHQRVPPNDGNIGLRQVMAAWIFFLKSKRSLAHDCYLRKEYLISAMASRRIEGEPTISRMGSSSKLATDRLS